jgi:hypothetical protein
MEEEEEEEEERKKENDGGVLRGVEKSEWGHVQCERDLGTSPRQPASKRVGSPTSTPSYASILLTLLFPPTFTLFLCYVCLCYVKLLSDVSRLYYVLNTSYEVWTSTWTPDMTRTLI